MQPIKASAPTGERKDEKNEQIAKDLHGFPDKPRQGCVKIETDKISTELINVNFDKSIKIGPW